MPKPGPDQPYVGAGEPADQDVADLVVHGVRPVHPALLHEHALEPGAGGDGGDLAGVVGLHAADGDERVAALGERVGDEVLQLAGLVAAVRDAGVAVLALGPDGGAAEVARSAAPAGAPARARRAAGSARRKRGTWVLPGGVGSGARSVGSVARFAHRHVDGFGGRARGRAGARIRRPGSSADSATRPVARYGPLVTGKPRPARRPRASASARRRVRPGRARSPP